MRVDEWLIGTVALAMALLLTGVVRRLALSSGLLDVPNPRSSHTTPTPRGGGLAIVLASLISAAALLLAGRIHWRLFLALAGGGTAVALIGLLDDRRPLPAAARITVHFAAALGAMVCLGGWRALFWGGGTVSLGIGGYVLGTLVIVWCLNLFNFMDGIDGLAGGEAGFVFLGSWALGVPVAPAMLFALGAAACGFLVWNWPPAKIFMGDVGSGYVGYVMGVMLVASAQENPAFLWVWLILGGVFFVDATLTLARRTVRGDRVYQAHRTHAYQWLARKWRSHARVTVAVLAVNLLWLMPLAWFSATNPRLAPWITLGALAPLAAAAVAAGAGRPESH